MKTIQICFMVEFNKEEIAQLTQEANIKVGERIKEIRQEKGISQTQLANRINSDRQYLYKIENAKVGISIGKLVLIARALEVKPEELLKGLF